MRPDSHTQLPNNCLPSFFLFFSSFGDVAFSEYFCIIKSVIGLLIVLESLKYFSAFPNFYVPKFENRQAPRGRGLFIFKFGKFGKLKVLESMLLLLQPLWVTILSLVHAKGIRSKAPTAARDKHVLIIS